MSEPAAAAPAEGAAPAPAEPASALTGQDPFQSLSWMDRIKAKYGENPGAEPEQPKETPKDEPAKAEPAPAEAAKAEPEKPKDEPPPAEPEPAKEPEPPKRLELHNARLLAENKKAVAESLSHKARADKAEAEWTDWKAQFEKNPFKALEKLTGKQLPELIEKGKAGAYDKPELELPPEVRRTMEWAEAEQKRQAERAAADKRKADFAADLPKVKQFVTNFAKDFPVAAVVDDAPEAILEEYYRRLDKGEKADLRAVAREMETAVHESTSSMFRNAKLVKHLAAADPEVRKSLSEALGLNQQNSASPASSTQGVSTPTNTPKSAQPAHVPTSVANAAEVPERSTHQPTDEELRQESLRLYREARERDGRFST